MRPFSIFVAFAIALGACAPSRTVVGGPASVPPPSDTRPSTPVTPEPIPAAEPAEDAASAIPSAPERWWLLDPVTDGVYGTGVDRAYRELLAGKAPRDTIVVAIIDSGVDIEHEDLDDILWVNKGEIPGNGRDDDGNGYVDDVHGWNFIGGRDGRHVHQDTYEVTRLYARYRHRFEGANPDTFSASVREEYERYREVEAAFRAKREENARMLQQIRMMDQAVDRFTAVLKAHLGVDSLSAERVAAIRSPRSDIIQAQQVYLQLAANGISPEMIDEELKRLEELEEYGLNPDFDPRPIVGDNYDDPTERIYGNPDVEGPSADHGTHVSGIVAAERENGIGIDGIAPAVRIMVIRAVPDGDERDKDVANAIRYAVDNGARIINMSFGKSFSPEKRAVDDAVRYADEKGVLMVHAAGNDGADLGTEPNYPNRWYLDGGSARLWIEVGASSWEGPDRLAAPFSNYGREKVDVFAPGAAILSTVPGSRYQANSGTSMAAPVVTGIAALLMSYFPELSAEEVRRIILESATRYPDQWVLRPGSDGEKVRFGDLSVTGGIVNAYEAVRMAEEVVRRKR
jgi:subtilisin family serine protease